MATQPLFSVILANYNGQRYLRECLDSVLAQTHDNFEFIVVDDGSTDCSPEIIAEYARREPRRLRPLLLTRNQGQGPAFNHGFAVSTGRLVAFIDSDDLWFPEKLSTVAAQFGDPAVVAMHQHNLRILRGTTPTDEVFRTTLVIGDVFREAMATKRPPLFVATTGLTFSRRVLERIGPIPDGFRTCADGFLTRTAMCFGRVSGSDVCCGAYRVHDDNQTFNNPAFDTAQYLRELLLPQLNAFYQARSIPLSFPVTSAPAARPLQAQHMRLLRLCGGERLLMVRSAPVDRMAQVLTSIFASHADVRIDLLVQPGFEGVFNDARITLLPLAAGPVSQASVSSEIREYIKGRHYAFGIVPYNEHDGHNYENIHEVLQGLLTSCPLVGVGVFGTLCPIAEPVDSRVAEPETSLFAPLPTWRQLRDCHKGRRAFIIGNDSALSPADLERLKGEISFAADGIYRVFGATAWRPTYYAISGREAAAEHAEQSRQLGLLTFLPSLLRSSNCAGLRTLWYEDKGDGRSAAAAGARECEMVPPEFSREVSEGLYGVGAGTVNYQLLQIAFHMGIREVHLLGVDCAPRMDARAGSPEQERQQCAFRSASAVFEQAGGRVLIDPPHSALSDLHRDSVDANLPSAMLPTS